MVAEWTGEIVALLHVNGISQNELAREMGNTPQYVCMVLNGKRSPNGIDVRMKEAITAIVERKKSGDA